MESDGTRAADFAQTTRGSTLAMRAAMDAINSGESEYAMLVASDARIGFLGEMSEQTSGDAAVAFVLGKENTIAEIEGMVSITEEFTEVWKGKEETYLRTYDARFTREKGYFRFVKKAGESLLKKLELAPDKIKHVVLEPTNAELDPLRRAEELAKTMGFSGKTRIFSRLIDKIGSPGNASIFLGLADLLDRSSPHERIICINYAAGSDAFSVLTGDEVEKRRNRKTVDAYVKSKENVDYVKYLEWKEIMKPTHDKLEGVI
jgi:hydroxymethylglutaryl-CoA synthase